MILLVVQNHPHRTVTDFRGKLVRRLAHDAPTFSEVGASGKPGAVHYAMLAEQPMPRNSNQTASGKPGADQPACRSLFGVGGRGIGERIFWLFCRLLMVPTLDGKFSYIAGGYLSIGGLAVRDLVEKFGTPLYVYDADAFTGGIVATRAALSASGATIAYAMKANPSLQAVNFALSHNLEIDVCSMAELFIAKVAGADPHQLSYTGVGLTVDEVAELVSRGIRINLDSLDEVDRRVGLDVPGTIGLRVALDIEAGFHPHCRTGGAGGKFGLTPAQVLQAAARLESALVKVVRLHTHLGSSIGDTQPYKEAMAALLNLAKALPDVQTINLGGGFGVPFHPDDPCFPMAALDGEMVRAAEIMQQATGRMVRFTIEPGEFLASEMGYLLTRVLVTKPWARMGEGEHNVAIVDGGMNLLPAHSLYGSYYDAMVDGKGAAAERSRWTVYGPTNQSGDRLLSSRELPDLVAGDIIILPNAGAYAFCRSSQFNSRPRPAEVWVENGVATIIRQPETMATMIKGQFLAT